MKNHVYLILIIILSILSGLISCNTVSENSIIDKIFVMYQKENENGLEMSIEKIKFRGKNIVRMSGWKKKSSDLPVLINPQEWTIIFCDETNYEIIKGTGFRPIDSILKSKNIKCLNEFNKELN